MTPTGVYGVGSRSKARLSVSFLSGLMRGGTGARESPWGSCGSACALLRLSGELGASHQELIHCPRALAAFPDRPYHQGLSAPHVAGRINLGHGSGVAAGAV